MGPVECLTCGKVIDGRDTNFCSDDCSDEWYDDDIDDEPYEFDELAEDDADSCELCGDPDCFGECIDDEEDV